MHSYGQFCPVALAAEIFCERWTAVILRELISGSARFSDIQRGAPLMSPALLTKRLKELEEAGVIEKRPAAAGKGSEYHLTDAGREFEPLVRGLGAWGKRWVRASTAAQKLDASLLMYDMRRSVDPGALPGGTGIVRFDYADQPPPKQSYWLVCEPSEVNLCLIDPGVDPDLEVFTDLATMTAVWRSDISVSRAMDMDRIELHGPAPYRRSFRAFLGALPWGQFKSRVAA